MLQFPRLKISRALALSGQIEVLLEEYERAFPHYSAERVEGNYVLSRIYRSALPPPMLTALIGDAIHNVRSSLDALACELAKRESGDDAGVYFPVANNEASLPKAIKDSRFAKTGTAAKDLLLSLRPFKDGHPAIYPVHRLDIEDKHRGIELAISNIDARDAGIGIGMNASDPKVGHLGGGSHILDQSLPGRTGVFALPTRFTFHHMTDFADKDVVGTLRQLALEISYVIDQFEEIAG